MDDYSGDSISSSEWFAAENGDCDEDQEGPCDCGQCIDCIIVGA